MSDAYNKIFTRIGVPYQRVEGDNGNIGGTSSHEFHYPAGIGKEGDNGNIGGTSSHEFHY